MGTLIPPQNLDLSPPRVSHLKPGLRGPDLLTTEVGSRPDLDQSHGNATQDVQASREETTQVELILVKGIQGEVETAEMFGEVGTTTASEEMTRGVAEGHDPGRDLEKGAGRGPGLGIADPDRGREKGVGAVAAVTERDPWTSEKKLNRNWLPLKQLTQI